VRRLIVVIALLALGAAPAHADSGRLVDFSQAFTTKDPASPTGLTVHVVLRKAGDPSGKPPALRSAVIRGPDGLHFDTSAVPECTASDEELRARGPDACPQDSLLTVGSFSSISGFGPPLDPFLGDDYVFDGRDQLIEVITFKDNKASPAFDRLTISGATLTAHPPMAPGGPPDGEMAVRSLDFAIPTRSARGKSLITTPAACPAGGQWTTTATFGFGDGSSDTVSSRAPCVAAGAQPTRPRPPTLGLAVHPRRVRTGRRVRLRLRARSSSRSCISGARVRVAGRAIRTDRRGRATLTLRFVRAGARRVRATHRGCRAARTSLRVVG
jgi:hypothetical protein